MLQYYETFIRLHVSSLSREAWNGRVKLLSYFVRAKLLTRAIEPEAGLVSTLLKVDKFLTRIQPLQNSIFSQLYHRLRNFWTSFWHRLWFFKKINELLIKEPTD